MKINRVLDYYYRAYNRAAQWQEKGRPAIEAIKRVIGTTEHSAHYKRLRRIIISLFASPLYWPNTFLTGVDQPTAELLIVVVSRNKK